VDALLKRDEMSASLPVGFFPNQQPGAADRAEHLGRDVQSGGAAVDAGCEAKGVLTVVELPRAMICLANFKGRCGCRSGGDSQQAKARHLGTAIRQPSGEKNPSRSEQ